MTTEDISSAVKRFESDLEQLETLVTAMERDKLDLETALAHFESGVLLAQKCKAQLESAQNRVDAIIKEGNDGNKNCLEINSA